MSIKSGMAQPHLDNIQKREQEKSAKEAKLSELRELKSTYEEQAEYLQSDEEYNRIHQELSKKIAVARKKEKLAPPLGPICLLLTLCFGILVILAFLATSMYFHFPYKWLVLIPIEIFLIAGTVIFLLMSGWFFCIRDDKQSSVFENKLSLHTKWQSDAKSAISKMPELKKEIASLEREIKELSDHTEDNKNIRLYCTECIKIYEALREGFANIIDATDWQHVDYLIYTIETHRAANLKEALQQLDMVKRHDELKGLMINVGKTVCKAIAVCATSLSYKLDSLIETQNATNKHIKELKDNVLSASQMQTALLEKSNESSEKLATDVRTMKQYADTMAIRNNITI